jgi:hypothetical protein
VRGKKRSLKAPQCADQSGRKATTRDGNAMSESMRELILSFVSSDPEQTWNIAAYTRRRAAS